MGHMDKKTHRHTWIQKGRADTETPIRYKIQEHAIEASKGALRGNRARHIMGTQTHLDTQKHTHKDTHTWTHRHSENPN